MFHTLNADQRLLGAYRRLLLAAGMEAHMWRDDKAGSPVAWLEIELTTVAGCVPPVTMVPVCDRFRKQGFAWHGPPPQRLPDPEPEPECEPEPGATAEAGVPPNRDTYSCTCS